MAPALERPLFSPDEAMAERRAAVRAARKTPVQPSQRDRSKARPRKRPGDAYTVESYRRATRYACRKAGVPGWHPHQLRHKAATNLRREFGLDVARAVLGQWKGQLIRVNELAASVPPENRKEVWIGDKRQWYFTVTLHIPEVNHKVRIVVLWRDRQDSKPIKLLVTNRTTREVSRIVRVYRRRWTGTETFHRDGKQQLGLGDCQLRDLQGQTRYIDLVMLAYSLLMGQLRQGSAKEWALHEWHPDNANSSLGSSCVDSSTRFDPMPSRRA